VPWSDMLSTVSRLERVLEGALLFSLDSTETIAAQLRDQARRIPDHTFLLFGEQRYSYAQANAQVNRHAQAYRALGIGHGDVVALLMENRPEFLWHYFGLQKLGAVASLVNTHLQADALAHAVRICEPKCIAVGSEVWPRLSRVIDQVRPDARAITEVDTEPGSEFGEPGLARWQERVRDASQDEPDVEAPKLRDQAAYIYTSGTTGLPKAAIVRNERCFRAGRVWAAAAFRFQPSDVLYNCLPLYHANAILLATGSVITAGVSMVLSRKFSSSRFWDEVRQSRATSFIYIGELCRYLINNPELASDREHAVRTVSGNGLRPDIWRKFQRRFGVRRIAEFYAATESNAITLNVLGMVGSVGPMLPGMKLARWDETTRDFVRDARGRLQSVAVGEPGLLLGKIRARSEFEGYQDRAASEQKIIRGAFRDGDAWFNTGDLLRVDGLRHLYFVDRLGDTFRWKGENVATSEVQEHLAKWDPVAEVSVYGVPVPGTEGKAGMAAVVLRNGHPLDVEGLREHVVSGLPGYARPVFVRVLASLDKTSTFKLKKGDLQREGYDPHSVPDALYFLRPDTGRYVELGAELFDEIHRGQLRL
jgi:acyl-CoA synthetase (AMP-forming)/AMP-acid ligase II